MLRIMSKRKPKILITNDDGIRSKGLWHLWHAIKDHADATVVAPAIQKSGVGLSLTIHKPITINPYPWEGGSAWSVTGTPADCVRLGRRIILNEKPDLVLSGINRGSNSGRNVLYSGTLGGVIEGSLRGVPGIGFSSTEFETDPQYEKIEKYVLPLVNHVLEHPLGAGTVLNVNFPTHFEEFKGVKLARQGRGLWVENPDRRLHPDGDPYFWLGNEWDEHDEHHESDVSLLRQGYITAVPIHVDELTDHKFLESRKSHFEDHFSS